MDRNQNNKFYKLLSQLKDIIEPFDMFEGEMDKYERPYKTFGNVIIQGLENLIIFERTIDFIWRFDNIIFNNYSRIAIIDLVIEYIKSIEVIKIEEFIKRINKLKAIETKDYWIFKEINGAELSENTAIQFGLFHVVDRILHKDYILSKTQLNKNQWDKVWQRSKKTLLIGINIRVKELARGYELMEKYFNLFENIIKYVAPTSSSNTQVDIIDKPESYLDNIYTLHSEGYTRKSYLKDYKLGDIDLNHTAFLNPKNGTEYLFSLISEPNPNEIQIRILKAVDWIGKGLKEKDNSKGFIEIMFGLESLLNNQENDIIQPSILNKMSENIAFTLGNNYDERNQLVKEFKYLYGIRSSIAHGRHSNFSEGDLIVLKNMARSIIREFLTNDELIPLNTFNKYLDWIKRKKYGD